MFESLQNGIQAAVKTLRGKGKLTEGNMREALELVEQSLLEADVSYEVVKDFMRRVSERSLGKRVLLALDPSQEVIGIVRDELVSTLGPVDPAVHLQKDVTILMLCGLQGSGKTTTCGKLARLLLNNKVKPLLVAADLQRPAAIQQLHVLGEQLGVPVYSETGARDPVQVCLNGVQRARQESARVVILDTAGRLAIDETLMRELQQIDRRVGPDQVYLVVDGMTGQDAVNSAKAFNEALELDGVIMTKLDGDARGGALLSVKHVTGVPIKFIGTGEQLDALEPFRPEGMAGRILGFGDVLALVDTARQIVDQEQQKEFEEKLRAGEFTLDDFRRQVEQFSRPGILQKMIGLLPGMGEFTKMLGGVDAAGESKRIIGIINSMTPEERRNPKIIDVSRRNRISTGAGVKPQQVNELVKQYNTIAPMMKEMAGLGLGGRMQALNELQRSGLLQGPGRLAAPKKGTGKRLTSKERAQAKKDRERELRRSRRKEN